MPRNRKVSAGGPKTATIALPAVAARHIPDLFHGIVQPAFGNQRVEKPMPTHSPHPHAQRVPAAPTPGQRLRSGIFSALLFAVLCPPMVLGLQMLMIIYSALTPPLDLALQPHALEQMYAAPAALLGHNVPWLATGAASARLLAQAGGLLALLVLFQVIIYSMTALPAAVTGLVHGLLWPAGGPVLRFVLSSALIAAPVSALGNLPYLSSSTTVWASTQQAALLGAVAAMQVAALIAMARAVSRHGQRVMEKNQR